MLLLSIFQSTFIKHLLYMVLGLGYTSVNKKSQQQRHLRSSTYNKNNKSLITKHFLCSRYSAEYYQLTSSSQYHPPYRVTICTLQMKQVRNKIICLKSQSQHMEKLSRMCSPPPHKMLSTAQGHPCLSCLVQSELTRHPSAHQTSHVTSELSDSLLRKGFLRYQDSQPHQSPKHF